MAGRIRRDDIVVVIAGDHKGARGKVLRVFPEDNRVLVEGVNMVYRHVRKTQRNPQGGRIQKEAALHISNVMPVDPRTDRPTRVRFVVTPGAAGQSRAKKRVATGRKASGATLSDVTRAPRRQSK
jgi:large subunit ribosomal protein L24